MILYKAYTYAQKIIKVEVVRATEKSVWLEGCTGRYARITEYESYWDTHKEAKDYLINVCKGRIENAKGKIKRQLEIMQELEKL